MNIFTSVKYCILHGRVFVMVVQQLARQEEIIKLLEWPILHIEPLTTINLMLLSWTDRPEHPDQGLNGLRFRHLLLAFGGLFVWTSAAKLAKHDRGS